MMLRKEDKNDAPQPAEEEIAVVAENEAEVEPAAGEVPETAKKEKIKVAPILTYTNHRMYPVVPRMGDFRIVDIAHALSMLPRANGHFRIFYSVAQHSLNCSYEAEARGYSKRIQLALLLHDGSEAYVADVPRPVKISLGDYNLVEERLVQLIYDTFGINTLAKEEQKMVDEIDTAFMYYEFEKLHVSGGYGVKYSLTKAWPLEERNRADVEEEYINRFRDLIRI